MYSMLTAGNTDSPMVTAKSLEHTRFVITGTGVSKQARRLYFVGRSKRTDAGDWATGMGGAKVYDDLDVARLEMKELQDYHDNSVRVIDNGAPFVTFKIKVVHKKDVMVARLKKEYHDLS